MNVTSLNKAIDPTTSAKQDAILAALGGGEHKLLAADVKTTEVATSETIQSLVGGDLQVGTDIRFYAAAATNIDILQEG